LQSGASQKDMDASKLASQQAELAAQKEASQKKLDASMKDLEAARSESTSHRAAVESAVKEAEAARREAAAAAKDAAAAKEALRISNEKLASTESQLADKVESSSRPAAVPALPAGMGATLEAEMSMISNAVDLEEDDTPAAAAVVHHAPKADLLLRTVEANGCRPTQCQVDAALQELRLLSLGPVGSPCIIPFADICAVETLEDDQDGSISISWVPNRDGAPKLAAPETVKLMPSDQEAGDLLMATLTVFDRAAPGDMLVTPESVTPRSSAEGNSAR